MGIDGRLILVSGDLLWVLVGRSGDVDEFGVNCAKLIPRGQPAAEEWVQKVRAYLADSAQEKTSHIKTADWLRVGEFASDDSWSWEPVYDDVRPAPAIAMGLLIPGALDFSVDYVINLDLLYFGFESFPVYNLLNMPSTEELPEESTDFERYLGKNPFGHWSWEDGIPAEFRYDFDRGPHLPVPPDAPLLRDICLRSTQMSVKSLLDPHRWKCSDEAVRVGVLQALVGMVMEREGCYPMLRVAQIRRDTDPRNWRWAAESLMRVASRLNYDFLDGLEVDSMRNFEEGYNFDADWPREDVCVHYARFLDDPAHLDAGIASAVKLARARHSSGFLWGIVFSVVHCVVVRIDARPGRPCVHTPALQFLPDWDDERWPDTAGLVALAQLFHIPPAPPACPAAALSPYHPLARLPLEVVHTIADAVERPSDLWALAHAVPVLVGALDNRLRRGSYVGEHRLVVPLTSTRPLSWHNFLGANAEGVYAICTLYAKGESERSPDKSYSLSMVADRDCTWYKWVYSMKGTGYEFKKAAFWLYFRFKVGELTEAHKECLPAWLSDVVLRPTAADFFHRREEISLQCKLAAEASLRRLEESIGKYKSGDKGESASARTPLS